MAHLRKYSHRRRDQRIVGGHRDQALELQQDIGRQHIRQHGKQCLLLLISGEQDIQIQRVVGIVQVHRKVPADLCKVTQQVPVGIGQLGKVPGLDLAAPLRQGIPRGSLDIQNPLPPGCSNLGHREDGKLIVQVLHRLYGAVKLRLLRFRDLPELQNVLKEVRPPVNQHGSSPSPVPGLPHWKAPGSRLFR